MSLDAEMPDASPAADMLPAATQLHPAPAHPYNFDLGYLMVNDANPIARSTTEADLQRVSRDCAQALVNQLLSTCAIQRPSTTGGTISALSLTLPTPAMTLPREKSVPEAVVKEKTKWEAFAERRGIKPQRRDARENREFDPTTGEWVAKWGFGGRHMREKQAAWCEEVLPPGESKDKDKKLHKGSDGRRETKGGVAKNGTTKK